MDLLPEDRYVVFLRDERLDSAHPHTVERPVAICRSYQEARQVRYQAQHLAQECVIRYIGTTGGGD